MLTTTATLMLAQSYFGAPDALAAPGGAEVWLNERAALTGIVLIVVALIAMAGPLRGVKKGWIAGLAVAAVGAGVWGFGAGYESGREAALAGADAFFEAAERGDRAAAGALLGPEVGVAAGGSVLMADGRGFVLGGIDRAAAAGLRELAVIERQAEVYSEGSARTQTQVRASFEGGGPNLVWVVLDWRKEGEAWRVRGVDIVMINGQAPGAAILGAIR